MFLFVRKKKYSCNCAPGYEGLRCEVNVDDCAKHRCANNATCVDLVEAYRCDCLPGYTGEHCEAKIPFCTAQHDPCKNGGGCVDHRTHYTCECKSGFAGANCTDNLDDCDNNLCQVSCFASNTYIKKVYLPIDAAFYQIRTESRVSRAIDRA